MTKRELEALNAELIDLLASLREQIDDKLDELAAVAEDEDLEPDNDGEEPEAGDDEPADDEDAEE